MVEFSFLVVSLTTQCLYVIRTQTHPTDFNWWCSASSYCTWWDTKTWHFIFGCDSYVSWSIFIFVHLKTGINTQQKRYRMFNWAATISPHYLVKLKATENRRPFPAVHSVELAVRNFSRKSLSIVLFYFYYFPVCKKYLNSCNSILAENLLHSFRVFIKHLS